MSDDEAFVTWASIIAGIWFLWIYYRRIAAFSQFNIAERQFAVLAVAPFMAVIGVFAVIKTAGSADVRDTPYYLIMYTVLGLVWFMGSVFVMELLGISYRDDAEERHNLAATIVVICALFAHAAIYAGANIGNGPGWWTVVVAGAIGSAAWFALWFLADLICGFSEDITVDRDVPAAIRLGGYALAVGLVCARGSAGDWTSFNQTVIEFGAAWAIVPMTAAIIAIEKFLQAQPEHYKRGTLQAVAIAAGFLVAAGAALQFAGPLPHNPQYDYLNTPSQ